MKVPAPPFTIETFRPRNLNADAYAELAAVHNDVAAETRPDDPPRPVSYVRDLYASLERAKEFRRHFWLARWRERVVGVMTASARVVGGNQQVLHVELLVAPGQRRRGIGTALVRRAAATAREGGQQVVIGLVTGHEPLAEVPGGRFLRGLGAGPGLQHRIYRLELEAVDRGMLEGWLERGEARSPDVEAVWRTDAFRPEELEAVSHIMRVMNTAPHGELEVEPVHFTPESVADRDRALRERGIDRTVLLLRQRHGGPFLGYTMLQVDPYDSRLFRQADTAVDPAARGRGLGKWLKAAMLLRMMGEHPERSEVRTGTADDNEAMLAINRRIGFRPWLAHSVWQVRLDALEQALAERR